MKHMPEQPGGSAPLGRILVTGGAGFIGSHFVRRILNCHDVQQVVVLDALTYAGSLTNLDGVLDDPRLTFVEGNVLDAELVDALVADADAVVHLAAESHVDRSFSQAGTFLSTNVLGTFTLLDAVMRHRVGRMVAVSTDEVYGTWLTGAAAESAVLNPTVPYAASKAAADLIALAYHRTHGVPVCVTRASNNYGPGQHPEKLIPAAVTALLKGREVLLHGDGGHVRNWLHVADHCAGLELALRHGVPGEVYNLGGGTDLTNNELVGMLLDLCGAGWDRVRYVPDRQANDAKYSIDCTKAAARLGYAPSRDLADGLAETVDWYRHHTERWAPAERSPQASLPRIRLATGAEA